MQKPAHIAPYAVLGYIWTVGEGEFRCQGMLHWQQLYCWGCCAGTGCLYNTLVRHPVAAQPGSGLGHVAMLSGRRPPARERYNCSRISSCNALNLTASRWQALS